MEPIENSEVPYKASHLPGSPKEENGKIQFSMLVELSNPDDFRLDADPMVSAMYPFTREQDGEYIFSLSYRGGWLDPSPATDVYYTFSEKPRDEITIAQKTPILGNIELWAINRFRLPLLPEYESSFHSMFDCEPKQYKPKFLEFDYDPLDSITFHLYFGNERINDYGRNPIHIKGFVDQEREDNAHEFIQRTLDTFFTHLKRKDPKAAELPSTI